MNPDNDPSGDLLQRLGEQSHGGFPASDERLDPNLAAAFVEGRLLPEERERLRTTLDAQSAVELDRYLTEADAMTAASASGSSASGSSASGPGLRWRPWVAAAALLVAALGLFWALQSSTVGDDDVNAALAQLGRFEPELFRAERPLQADERAPSPMRSERRLTVHAPRKFVLEGAPTLRWSDDQFEQSYEVVVELSNGTEQRRAVTGTSVTWDELGLTALRPGERARWRVTAPGGDSASTFFQVLSAAGAEQYQAKLAAIRKHVAPNVGPVISALIALRAELYEEALRFLEDADEGALANDLTRRARSFLEDPLD